jgi:hypothetical protein
MVEETVRVFGRRGGCQFCHHLFCLPPQSSTQPVCFSMIWMFFVKKEVETAGLLTSVGLGGRNRRKTRPKGNPERFK